MRAILLLFRPPSPAPAVAQSVASAAAREANTTGLGLATAIYRALENGEGASRTYSTFTSVPSVVQRIPADGTGDRRGEPANSRIALFGRSETTSLQLWERKGPTENASVPHLPSLRGK